jgi:hypothetical protein
MISCEISFRRLRGILPVVRVPVFGMPVFRLQVFKQPDF